MDFGSWLAGHGASDDGANENDGEHVDDEDGTRARNDAETPASSNATTSAGCPVKDCRTESGLMTSVGRPGCQDVQEMAVLLGATGVPASKCPVVPTKVVSNVLAALYEPLVKLEVGVLTRTMESPMQLKPREQVGRGTLSLYILPDDSLSLTFEGPLDSLHGWETSAQTSKEVMDIVNMNLGLTEVRDIDVHEVHGTVWEELARFPRWREQRETSIVTVHMLKGDKTGRSFYVMAGEDAAPPLLSLSSDGQRKFDEFRGAGPATSASSTAATSGGDADRAARNNSRHYFWITGPNVEDSIHALGKIKSYIKRPPTLAKIACVPEHVLETVSEWVANVDETQRERAAKQGKAPTVGTNPLNNLGAVMGRRVPQMVVNQSLSTKTDGTCNFVDSDVQATANASAVFKDSRFNISCPCCVSVVWGIKSTIRVESLDAAGDRDASRDPGRDGDAHGGVRRQGDEHIMRAAATVVTAEVRCESEVLARKAVEAIGRIRIEEWICEDFLRNTRKHKIQAKAERQRKKDLQRGYAALNAAQPMIQRAVANLPNGRAAGVDADRAYSADSVGSDCIHTTTTISTTTTTPTPTPTPHGVDPADAISEGQVKAAKNDAAHGPVSGKKISINDLPNFF